MSSREVEESAIPSSKVKSAISTLWVSSFVQHSAVLIVLLGLPSLTSDLESSIFVTIWVILGYAAVQQSLIVPLSRLGDLFGRKLIFVLGFVIVGVGGLVAAVSPTAEILVAARLFAGVGAAMSSGLGRALIVDIAPRASRGRALGISTSGTAMGTLGGPAIGGLLLTVTSWRGVFAYLALADFIMIILVLIFIPKISNPRTSLRKFDWQGGATFSGGLITSLLGLTWVGNPGVPIETSYLLFVISAISFAAFAFIETKKDSPMLDLKLFKIPQYGKAASIALPAGMAVQPMPLIMVFYLQSVMNLTPGETAAIIFVLPAVQLLDVLGGWAADKIGSAIPMLFGLSVYSLTFLLLFLRAPVATIPELMLYLGILGFGAIFTMTPLTSMALGSLPKNNLGVGAGLLHN
ncbi:MAG: MFS transporter, partial [Nitrososphaerales archaeon]